jgi:hypothetical protein
MKRTNVYEFCEFGENLQKLSAILDKSQLKIGDIAFAALWIRNNLSKYASDQGIFLQSSKRAAAGLVRSFKEAGIPDSYHEMVAADLKKSVEGWRTQNIKTKLSEFTTVLANDLPGIPTYYVSPKGIYSTDDLIAHADLHLSEDIRSHTSNEARAEICEAGKCLAYEIHTASAFHMWRAVELVMGEYYVALTGHSFEDAKVTRNWGQYIAALTKAKAATRITTFLDHIREEYRNPISHPTETLTGSEAFNLFGAAVSSINQTVMEIVRLGHKNAGGATAPSLPSSTSLVTS